MGIVEAVCQDPADPFSEQCDVFDITAPVTASAVAGPAFRSRPYVKGAVRFHRAALVGSGGSPRALPDAVERGGVSPEAPAPRSPAALARPIPLCARLPDRCGRRHGSGTRSLRRGQASGTRPFLPRDRESHDALLTASVLCCGISSRKPRRSRYPVLAQATVHPVSIGGSVSGLGLLDDACQRLRLCPAVRVTRTPAISAWSAGI